MMVVGRLHPTRLQDDRRNIGINFEEMRKLHVCIQNPPQFWISASTSTTSNDDESKIRDRKHLAWLLQIYPWDEMTDYKSLYGNSIGASHYGSIIAAVADFILDIRAVLNLYGAEYKFWAVIAAVHLIVLVVVQSIRAIYIFHEYYLYKKEVVESLVATIPPYRYRRVLEFFRTGNCVGMNNGSSDVNPPWWSWICFGFPSVVLLRRIIQVKKKLHTLKGAVEKDNTFENRQSFINCLAEMEFLKFQIGEFSATELFVENIPQLFFRFLATGHLIITAELLSIQEIVSLLITFVTTGMSSSGSATSKLGFHFQVSGIGQKFRVPMGRMPDFTMFDIIPEALLILPWPILFTISLTVGPFSRISYDMISIVCVCVAFYLTTRIRQSLGAHFFRKSFIKCFPLSLFLTHLLTSYSVELKDMGKSLGERNILKLFIFTPICTTVVFTRFQAPTSIWIFAPIWSSYVFGLCLSVYLRNQWIGAFGSKENFYIYTGFIIPPSISTVTQV